MKPEEITAWLRAKLEAAEKALKARLQAEEAWLDGDDESWRAVGCKLSKKQRIEIAERERRISLKCRTDVEMFKALLDGREHNEFPEVK